MKFDERQKQHCTVKCESEYNNEKALEHILNPIVERVKICICGHTEGSHKSWWIVGGIKKCSVCGVEKCNSFTLHHTEPKSIRNRVKRNFQHPMLRY